jgi:hypothetical protein
MNWVKLANVAAAAVLIGVPATSVTVGPAHADCGDPNQPPCTGAVPSTDQVVAVLAELTDPGIPASNKTDIVTPGFSAEEAGTIDSHLNRMRTFGGLLPLPFVVRDIEPAPNNFAGATVNIVGGFRQNTGSRPIVLVNQGGHWLLTHDSAIAEMNAIWQTAERPGPLAL